MNENDTFGSEFDEALNNQSENSTLQPSFLALMSVKSIINVCANEFHQAIILRNNDGVAINYLPDMLEAFENSVAQLEVILEAYKDAEFQDKMKNEVPGTDRASRRLYSFKLQKELFCLMKRINLMPGENTNLLEIIGMTKTERKALAKEEVEATQ